MIGKMGKSVIAIGAACVLVAVIVTVIIIAGFNAGQRNYRFFYPDNQYQKLSSEQRSIRVKDKTGASLEIKLLKEYVLGPVHYSLKLVIRDDIIVRNVWSVQNGDLYINFNEGFGKYLRNNNEDCKWFLTGMVATLRENTPYKKVFILINDNRINDSAGEYQLAFPVVIRPEVK